jgi:hypothetical protein
MKPLSHDPSQPLAPEQIALLNKIVADPRFVLEKYTEGLKPAAELKLAIVAGGLVGKLNRAYGWNLTEDGNWPVERSNDIIFDIVCRPDYTLERFIAAIKSGRRM